MLSNLDLLEIEPMVDKTYNEPSVNEVAVLMPNDPVGQRDIILHTRSNQL